MKDNKPSIDGFIPRRPGSQLGDLHEKEEEKPIDRSLHTGENIGNLVGAPRQGKEIGKEINNNDIESSLKEIDAIDLDQKDSRKERKRRRKEARIQRPKSKKRRIIKWVIIGLLILGALAGGYVILKGVLAGQSVFNGSILDLVQNQPLKEDKYGRSNFLVVGTSEDDPNHDAPWLTDSIMIISVDQDKKDAYTFSIPRDLYVDYGGLACLPGYRGKINSYFNCRGPEEAKTSEAEQERLTRTQKFIGDIVGMDIQYGVHVNYTVMRDVVKAIGNKITIKIESRNPNGQMDSNFDWKCGSNIANRVKVCPPNGHYIDYPNGEVTLDAEHALYLAQARGDRAPTYGFEQSNFDRERNQQKILVAIREKAVSAGTLTNLGAVTGLIDALGKNLRTNIQTKEVRTLMQLGIDIPSASIQSIDLYKEGEAQLRTGLVPGAGSNVFPVAGLYNYTNLRTYLHKIINSSPVDKEAPHLTVMNGGRAAGVAQTEADKLVNEGFTVDSVTNAPKGDYAKVVIYQIDKKKPASLAKLQELYPGATVITTKPSFSVVGATDFVVILGPQ